MTCRTMLSTLALAAAATAALSGAALADRGRMGGDGGPVQMLMDRFDEIDTDKDGRLTEAELEAHRAARFAAADANADGALDAAELSAFQLKEMEARAAERAARMLERLDDSGDGMLQAAEMPGMDDRGPGFARLDGDDDGALSKAEVEAMLAELADHRGHGRRGHGKDD